MTTECLLVYHLSDRELVLNMCIIKFNHISYCEFLCATLVLIDILYTDEVDLG